MIKKIKNLDVFARSFSFRATKKSNSFTTVIGGLCTLFTGIMVLLIGLNISSNFIDTKNPVVSVNKIKLRKAPRLNLLKNHTRMAFIVLNATDVLKSWQIEQYFTFECQIITTTTRDSDGRLVDEVKPVRMVDCGSTRNYTKSKREQEEALKNSKKEESDGGGGSQLFFNTTICPDFEEEDWHIMGSPSNLPYRRIVFKIYPCSLPDRSQCANLLQLSLTIIGNIPTIKVANYNSKNEPLQFFVDGDSGSYVDTASKTVMNTYYKENEIYDDDSDFLDEKLSFSYIDVDRVNKVSGSRLSGSYYCTKGQIESGACEAYTDVVMRPSFEKTVIKRRYKKFFSSVSEIGGFADLIIYGVWALYWVYNYWAYQRWVRGQLVDHFVELDKRRSLGEVKRLRTRMMSLADGNGREKMRERGKTGESSGLAFRRFFNSKVDFEKLFELNCQSKVLLLAILRSRQDSVINVLFARLLINQKALIILNQSRTNKEKLKAKRIFKGYQDQKIAESGLLSALPSKSNDKEKEEKIISLGEFLQLEPKPHEKKVILAKAPVSSASIRKPNIQKSANLGSHQSRIRMAQEKEGKLQGQGYGRPRINFGSRKRVKVNTLKNQARQLAQKRAKIKSHYIESTPLTLSFKQVELKN